MSAVIQIKKIPAKESAGTASRSTESVLQRNYSDYADDHQHITRAREAAEALFAPKRQISEQTATENPPLIGASTRKPRVLRVEPAPIHHERVTAPVRPEPQTRREIPKSHFARIRTWLTYGMTVSQVAELYGVPVEQVECIAVESETSL
jgi:hypothetical protein